MKPFGNIFENKPLIFDIINIYMAVIVLGDYAQNQHCNE
jgi:hypothetical protein